MRCRTPHAVFCFAALYFSTLVSSANGMAQSAPAVETRSEFPTKWRFIGTSPRTHIDECIQYPDNTPTLKILFAPGDNQIGDYFYDVAQHVGDLKQNVDLERFREGVQGAHYSASQVLDWVKSLDHEKRGEHPLVQELLDAGFLRITDSKGVETSGTFAHVIGLRCHKEQSPLPTLIHELLHVRYEHDSKFRSEMQERWDALPMSSKMDFKNKIRSSYVIDKECQVTEEWAVREMESQLFDQSGKQTKPAQDLWDSTAIPTR